MLLELIALAVLVLAVIGIAILIGRKFPTLAAIDVQATLGPASERKTALVEQRLKRKVDSWRSRLTTASQPSVAKVTQWFEGAQRRLTDLQHEYRVRSLPVMLNRRQQRKVQSEVESLLQQARLFRDEQEHAAAEEKALQAIRLDMRSVAAFEFLGALYLDTKQYQHAKEVYRYLLKLEGDSDALREQLAQADLGEGNVTAAEHELKRAVELNATVMRYHLELAQVERQLGNLAAAFEQIQEAVRLEPNHPKVLDEMIEISLGYGKREFAESALLKIKSTNPDNQKIAEWEERLQSLA